MIRTGFIIFFLTAIISCAQKTARKICDIGFRQAKRGDNYKAEYSFKQALQIDSSYVNAYIGLGQLKMNSPDSYEKGLAFFDKALLIDSKKVDAWAGKGYIQLQQKNYSSAIDSYTKAIGLDSKKEVFYYQRAYARYNSSDTLYKQDFKKSCELGNLLSCDILEKLKSGN